MPVRSDMREMKRAGSTSSLNRDQPLRLASTNDSVFDRYGSSPDLAQSHTRTSSTDSADGGYSHSRQSSGSTDGYPTRRLSTGPGVRKSSSSNNPMQFVKVNKADDLTRSAFQQMEAAKVINKMRPAVEAKLANDEQDWQSNFDSWKSKRRKSTPSFQKITESEGLFKDEEEEPQERKTKTFSQIMAEKTKRKSLGNLNSYPYEEEDSGFGNSRSESITAQPADKEQTKKKSSKKKDIAPWAQNSSDEGDSQSDSETNNSHQSGDTDSVFSDKSLPKQSDDDSWVKNKTPSQTNSTNKIISPKVNKSLSESRRLFENSVQNNEKHERKTVDMPVRSGERNIRNIKDAFEQKDKDAKAVPEITRRPNRLNSSDRPWKSMDMSTSDKSFSEKPLSPLSPKSPAALAPRISSAMSPNRYGSLPRDSRPSDPPVQQDKLFTEKMIKINQKPNNAKGFGFSLTGGMEKKLPVTVQRVNLGSAADVCELEANDELISINGRDVSNLTLAQVQGMVEHSVKRGQIELRVKRFMDEGSYDSVEEEEMVNSNKMDTQSSGASSLSTDLTSEDTYKLQEKVQVDSGSETQLMDKLIREKEREPNNNMAKINSQPLLADKPPSPVVVEEDFHASVTYGNQSVPKLIGNQTSIPPQYEDSDVTDGNRPELRRDMSYPAEEMIIEERQTFSISNKTTDTANQSSPSVIRRTMTPSKQFAEIQTTQSPAPPTPKVDPPALMKPAENLNSSITSDDSSSSSNNVGPPAALLRWQRPRTKSEYKNPLDEAEKQAKAAKRLSSTLPWTSRHEFSLESYSKDDSMMDKVNKSFQETLSVEKPVENKKITPYKFNDEARQEAWDQKQEKEREPEDSRSIDLSISTEENLTAQSDAPMRKVGHVEPPDLTTVNVSLPLEAAPLSPQEKFERDQQKIRMQYEEEKKKNQKQEQAKMDEENREKYLQTMESNISATKQAFAASHMTSPSERIIQPEPKFTSEPMTFQLNSRSPGRPLIIDPRNQENISGGLRDDSKPEFVFQVGLPPEEPLRNQTAISSQDLLEQERQRIREEEKRKLEEEKRRWREEQEREVREQQEKIRAEREKLQQEQEQIAKQKAMLEKEKLQPSKTYQVYSNPTSPHSSISHSPRSPPPALDPKHRDNKAPPPTAPKPQRGEKARLTRDDLLAMNRSAKPLTRRPEGVDQEPSHDSSQGPAMREAPSKGELHSLNAVPKQRVCSSREWISNEDRPFVIGKRSDLIHKSSSSNPQDHWLVQEAERRRKAEQESHVSRHDITARAGPAKPSESSLVSRFRGDIEPPPKSNRYIPSTDMGLSSRPSSSSGLRSQNNWNLDQGVKTQFNANTQPSYMNPSLSNTLPANLSFNANTSLPSKPPRSPQSESEPVIAVSGKQKCSHCGDELGKVHYI